MTTRRQLPGGASSSNAFEETKQAKLARAKAYVQGSEQTEG
jgi:hypothetical protein